MDFNIKTDINVDWSTRVQVDDMLELFLQEIDILFSIDLGTVVGNRNLGLDIESMLWKTNFNSNQIESVCHVGIETNCYSAQYFTWSVTVELIRGSVQDIGLIDIQVSNKNSGTEISTKTFVFK